jgi:hypothetical protein
MAARRPIIVSNIRHPPLLRRYVPQTRPVGERRQRNPDGERVFSTG